MTNVLKSESVSDVSFHCKIHGLIPLDQCRTFRSKNSKTGFRTYCFVCSQSRNIKSYALNKNAHDSSTKEWRKINQNKSRAISQKSNMKWRTNNPELAAAIDRKNNSAIGEMCRAIRHVALSIYGNQCQCCGISDERFLSIDHINGGGTQHRKSVKTMFWFWFAENNFPTGFRTLCHNCNMSYGVYGGCPHTGFFYNPKTPSARSNFRIRFNVMCEYGWGCACCQEGIYEFLALDHVNGGGYAHRRSGIKSGVHIARWARNNNYPDSLRVLCHNCNFTSGSGGQCAHNSI